VSQSSVRRFIATTLAFALALVLLPATGAAAAEPFTTLKRGDRGPDVRLAQQALTRAGLRTKADGVFGRQTHRNVHRYERRHRIAVDGRISRGQMRGMLRRARLPVRLLDRRPAPRAVAAGGAFTFPVAGRWEWGREGAFFGDRGGRHQGVDVFADCGTPLVAAEAGKVVYRAQHSAAGHYVIVRTASGEDHVYMHLQRAASVARGDDVPVGARLGAVGRTGNATACHLHFEIWTAPGWYEGGRARDPLPDLRRWSAAR
jgi:murein DD-endopeptidase MepM/ murein hydrolase activator NlpD